MNKVFGFLPVNTGNLIAGLTLLGLSALCQPAVATEFSQRNLFTGPPDPYLRNAWGMSYSPTGPFWVSDNGTGVSSLYSASPLDDSGARQGLVVTIPGDGSVTGQAFGGVAGQFNSDAFLFVSEDGTISGWRGALGTTAEILQTSSPNNVYKGAAFATTGGNSYLYAANFGTGTIDVLKGNAGAPVLAGSFTDPGLPSGYAPFNIQKLGDSLYVTYAKKGIGKDEESGLGKGFVIKFDLQGNFLGRTASQGTLDSPWGLAIAPSTFGLFANALLVGNFGDGRINAFDVPTNTFLGQLQDISGGPLAIDGLWGLAIGNNGNAGSSDRLYFTAGPNEERNGLFGVIQAVPEPGALPLLAAALLPYAIIRKKLSWEKAPKTNI